MKILLSTFLLFTTTLLLLGQSAPGIRIYGNYRIPDEISLGVSYRKGTPVGLSFEAGYNIRFKEVLDINGSEFNFEDFYSLPMADRGPFLRLGINRYIGTIGFVSASFILKKAWVEDTYKNPPHDNRITRSQMEYMQYGIDLNCNFIYRGFTFFGGVGHRYGVFDFSVYEFHSNPVDESFQQKNHFPVLNMGVAITIKEWAFFLE